MADPLRPLSTRELLVRTFSLYRHNFKLFLGVSIIGPVVALVCRLLFVGWAIAATRTVPRSATALMVAGIGVEVAIMLLFGLAISSAGTVRAVAAVCEGREVRVAEGYRALKGRVWRVIGIVFLVFVRAFLGGVLFIFAGMIALAIASTLGYNSRVEAGTIGIVCGSIATTAALLVAIGIYLRYAVAVSACVVEDIGVKRALERSTFLIRGDYVRVAAVYGVFVIFAVLMGLVLGAPTLLLRQHGIAFQIPAAVVGFVAMALTAPGATIGMSLVYYDERARKEVLDTAGVLDLLRIH